MTAKGEIVAGLLAPHPPHLVYAESPAQNEPKAECGWENLRWGYERMRKTLEAVDFDVIVILSPHWQTYIGYHLLGVPHFKSLSVDLPLSQSTANRLAPRLLLLPPPHHRGLGRLLAHSDSALLHEPRSLLRCRLR